MNASTDSTATLLRIGGQVQGVGFRPFAFRLAARHRLNGWVENHGAGVELLLQGEDAAVSAFIDTLLNQPPPLARPVLLAQHRVAHPRCSDFTIRPSRALSGAGAHIPADYFVCDECLRELHDPSDRRYRYPFINCTQCGPRYTLIDALPYDRDNTAMAGFPLCPTCRREYESPHDRRFHAEPIACPECGPQLAFSAGGVVHDGTDETLTAAVALLRRGDILALKGIGGYHLLCDARSERSVQRLRRRKARPDKPLAVMFPQCGDDGLALLRSELSPSAAEAEQLRSPQRPIVLCRRHERCTLADAVAPGLAEVGAMLPYSPLHHLLLQAMDAPLIATSGNISGEPVLTDNAEAERRLSGIADGFLHHNRPIRRPADDPLYRCIAGVSRPLRLGRGTAPMELALPFSLPHPVLAVGGEMKNSIALAWGNRAVLSPHIGELHTPRGMQVFRQVIADLQQLYGVAPKTVLHDAHPGYQSTAWARESGLRAIALFHHHAHASALYGEYWPDGGDEQWLVATWDGVGYGPDGTLWGGESLLGSPGAWRRFARFRPFRLPGGDRAGREPWRSALALCLETGTTWQAAPPEAELLAQAWKRRLNSPSTTAAGRLFDAAAALLGLCGTASYEGQGPMLLEAAAGRGDEYQTLPLQPAADTLWQCDWQPLLPRLMDESLSVAERAALFHQSLAQSLLQQALKAREAYGVTTVGLAGGVFQNRTLSESVLSLLQQSGFTVRLAQQLPCNDGGLAWGQLIESAPQLLDDHSSGAGKL